MVALLVVGTIIMCLLVDGIVLSLRQGAAATQGSVMKEAPVLVFAQDGGEEIEENDNVNQATEKVIKRPDNNQ